MNPDVEHPRRPEPGIVLEPQCVWAGESRNELRFQQCAAATDCYRHLGPGFAGKQVELLNEAVPGLRRIVVLANPSNASHVPRTREIAEVAQTVDRVVIIHRGRLIQQAAIADVLAGAQGATRVRTPDAQRLRDLLTAQGATVSNSEDGALLVSVPPERVGELTAANGIVLHELAVERATLEEVFLELTGGETTE